VTQQIALVITISASLVAHMVKCMSCFFSWINEVLIQVKLVISYT